MKNFTEIYTRAYFNTLRKVISRPNFNAYQIVSTTMHSHIASTALIDGKEISANIEIFTLIERYALEVWHEALTAMLKLFRAA